MPKTFILDNPTAISVSKSQIDSAIAPVNSNNSNRQILGPSLASFRNMAKEIHLKKNKSNYR